VEEITHDRVLVSPAPGVPGKMPFWKGETATRPLEFGRAIGALTRELRASDPDMAVVRLRERDDLDEKVEEYRRVMQVNVETMFLLSKHAIPAMIKTAKGGAIVNISSISALRPRGLTTYTTSKAAVIGLTQAMAVDHGRDNIRVNCICPGPMYTPMVYARGNGMSEAARAQRANASVLKTEGTGWDVGHAVKFLLSDYARYITGQVLVVDGGVTLQGPERDSRDH